MRAKAEAAALAAYPGPEVEMAKGEEDEPDPRWREDEFTQEELAALERDELESLDELFGPGFAPGPPDGA